MTTTQASAATGATPRGARKSRPAIIVSERDHRIVSGLARSALDRIPAVAEVLLDEMDRARIVSETRRPADVVGLGSEADYVSETGQVRTVRLVMPAEADIDAGRISILTPVGAALIGLSPGQSFGWAGPAGHRHSLTVTAVRPAV
ncbi:nucleoside diphosphate kinase regulator [Phreatobacter sp.]|uniref:nucleoside diphosphate kinase regulator n=1 Tax=Phreatobacter sp. TaxID=1966341 RepID=UPI003F6F82C0